VDWVETTGRTVEEAKRSALEQLGVEEKDAVFEVLAEPRVGLFGRLKEEARVRARLQPRYPRSKGERRDRRRSRSDAPATQGARAQGGERIASQPAERSAPAPAGSTEEPVRASSARRRRRGGKGHSPAPSTTRPANPLPSASEASLEGMSQEQLADQARLAEEFLVGLLERLGTKASVSTEVLEDRIVELNVTGEGLGILIGPRGTTLLALQELTRTVVQRHGQAAESRIVVDVNGYRKRRHEALARFARQVAQEVAATNTKRALEPMPPSDRKVVHDAVNEVPGVTTISEGEEPNRRVVLVPLGQEPAGAQEGGGQKEGPPEEGRADISTSAGESAAAPTSAGEPSAPIRPATAAEDASANVQPGQRVLS
jgi:spoIIIJ-associated protein